MENELKVEKVQPSKEELDVKRTKQIQKVVKIVVTTFTYVFLVLVAISVLFPFYWMLNSSLKSLAEYKWTKPSFFPQTIIWANYANADNTVITKDNNVDNKPTYNV